jgi:molybdopterin converting factor subunit 1
LKTSTRVEVLYFAGARDAVGKPGETLQFASPVTAGGVLDAVVKGHPALASMKSSIRIAVNQEIAPLDRVVKEGDEVGVLPPVAGG